MRRQPLGLVSVKLAIAAVLLAAACIIVVVRAIGRLP
jgi:hypothetical protein